MYEFILVQKFFVKLFPYTTNTFINFDTLQPQS